MSNENTMIRYRLRQTTDHDKKIQYGNREVLCYSQDQMDQLYPNGGYFVLGETLANNKKEQIASLLLGRSEFSVSKTKSHSRILYRVAGYARVGENEFILLLKSRLAFLILLFGGVLSLIALTALLISLLQPKEPQIIDPDHPVPTEDGNAAALEDDNSTRPDVEEGGGSLSMIYTLEAELSLSTGEISIYFKNPNSSTHDVSIILYVTSGDQEVAIAQSGLLKAGYGLNTLEYLPETATLTEGVYTGKYLLSCFDPETGERALVQPEITGVTITVLP